MLVEHSDKLEQAQYNFCLDQVQTKLQSHMQFLSQTQRATLNFIMSFEKENKNEQVFRNFLQKNILPEIDYEISSKWNDNSRFNNSNGRKDILYKSV
jgi:FMN-dependent NADH-azoreductase